MGLSLIDRLFTKKEFRLLLLGLVGAGKTTILYKLKLGEIVSSFPLFGMEVETVKYKNTTFTSWDVGGGGRNRLRWKPYYSGTQALIFVVDSSDRERIEYANEELQRLLNEDDLKDAALLVFANKQDLSGAMSSTEVAEKIDLVIVNDREWGIQGACAMTGDGLYEGLDWLSKAVSEKK